MFNRNLYATAKNILLVIIGTLILAFGTAVFIIPFDLVVGGMSGYAIIIEKIIPSPFLSVDMLITIMTWGFFLFGLIFLGKGFAAKTFVSSLIYPIGISLFSKLADQNVLNGIFYLRGNPHTDLVLVIASLFGGVLIGAGCAISFIGGGSTGGTDIIAFIVCKYIRKLRNSVAIFVIDSSAIILGIFVLRELVISLLGIMSIFVSALVIDKMFVGGTKALIVQIITEKPDSITKQIIKQLERTTTSTEVTGGYSSKKLNMLMVSITRNQYSELLNIINQNDKNAFVTVHTAHEIYGEDWSR